MAQLTIPEKLWRQFATVAQQRQQKPARLAEKLLRDYLQRLADEDLLVRSERAARGQPFRIDEAEELVRQHRRRKANRS